MSEVSMVRQQQSSVRSCGTAQGASTSPVVPVVPVSGPPVEVRVAAVVVGSPVVVPGSAGPVVGAVAVVAVAESAVVDDEDVVPSGDGGGPRAPFSPCGLPH